MANDFENGWTDDDGTKHEGYNKVLYNDFYGTEIKSAEAEIVNLRVFDNSKKEFVSKLENILMEKQWDMKKNSMQKNQMSLENPN